jgi:putative nucleotidyltransferase with HDIG domain
MSLSFAETFFTQFSWVFTAFTRSEREIEKLIEKSSKNFLEFVQLIARTLDAKDHYTAGHSLRVMNYALQIAHSLDLPKEEVEMLKQACLLHDIGKIGIPDGILNKRSPLSEKEREHIIRHPVVGQQILSAVADFQGILRIIQTHHERIDGRGYPEGLTRDEIPLLARILAVADTYDAIISERPYRKAKTKQDAITELKNVRDLQLDGTIVDKFIEAIS